MARYTCPVIVRAAVLADAAAITAIYNLGIAGHAATFETTPRSVADLERRLADVEGYPVVVADAGSSGVVGWAALSEYRPRACYRGIAEFSVYVAPDWHGRGVGRRLMDGLIAEATVRGFWKLVSRVFTFNEASRALCRSVGFREVGIYERHGYLDGAWRDVVIVERLIPENQAPGGPPIAQ
jgi:L-amino acid N-acyltransferase YncA